MPTYRVRLADDAFERGQDYDTGVSLFESRERYEQRVDDDGYVTLRKREFDRLQQLGDFIADSVTDPAAMSENPDLDDDNTRTRTLIPRLPQRSTAVHPGGVGHQPNDAYSNQQVQREIQRDVDRGAALRDERGLPPLGDTIPDASRRADGHLPEQVKENERLTRERDQAIEKADKQAEKDREKAKRDHEREEERQQKELEKAQKQADKDGTTRDVDLPRDQGQGLSEDQNADNRNQGDGESKAKAKTKAGGKKDEGS